MSGESAEGKGQTEEKEPPKTIQPDQSKDEDDSRKLDPDEKRKAAKRKLVETSSDESSEGESMAKHVEILKRKQRLKKHAIKRVKLPKVITHKKSSAGQSR